jgi:DUF917 family protein
MFNLDSTNDIEDLVVGTTIFGTGGGGNPENGRRILESDLKAGRRLRVATLDEIPDDALVVSPYYVGTVAPGVKSTKKVTITTPFGVGIDVIERQLKRKVAGTVASELGGGNTAAALHVAAELNIPMVDGDLMGRAGPELHQSTLHIFNVPMVPSAVVTETGDVVFIERYADIDDYESLARYVSVLAGGHAAVIDSPLTKQLAKRVVIEGTITKSLAVGRKVREANEESQDAVEAVRVAIGGWLIFRGTVNKYDWRNEKGFLFGEVSLKGVGESSGHEFRTWIKNEHILAWRDSKPIVMSPDLIMFLDNRGHAITNDVLKPGLDISVLATRAPEAWRSERGLEFFGPKHFGFDLNYVPVEELIK